MSTVDFYKMKIDDMRKNFEDMFDDQRKYEKIIGDDGSNWKQFQTQERMVDKLTDTGEYEAPTFEETMLIDTIRAMRKDKKELAKSRQGRK